MRGKGGRQTPFGICRRITPAYAGKSSRRVEKNKMEVGSPPPMRGKAFHDILSLRIIRITPAYAGKSFCVSGVEVRKRDHPRLCGEKQSFPVHSARSVGSPPPMRGKVAAFLSALAVY